MSANPCVTQEYPWRSQESGLADLATGPTWFKYAVFIWSERSWSWVQIFQLSINENEPVHYYFFIWPHWKLVCWRHRAEASYHLGDNAPSKCIQNCIWSNKLGQLAYFLSWWWWRMCSPNALASGQGNGGGGLNSSHKGRRGGNPHLNIYSSSIYQSQHDSSCRSLRENQGCLITGLLILRSIYHLRLAQLNIWQTAQLISGCLCLIKPSCSLSQQPPCLLFDMFFLDAHNVSVSQPVT